VHSNVILKHHIRLLRWSGHHALKPYIPAFSTLRQEPRDSDTAKSTAWIYGFKRHFKNADDFRMILEAAALHFKCDGIIPIPPSKPEDQPNSLQRLFGSPIRRIKAVETRKYNHRQSLSDDYYSSYEVEPMNGKCCLLVDGILRTGITMNHFRVTLARMGHMTVPMTLGLYHKHPYTTGDSISIFTEKSEMEMSLEKMIFEI
jgi:hypothetical protein